MARTRFDDWPCSVARTLDIVGDPWSALILRDAFYGARRFEDFAASLGIARNILTDRLQRLVAAGMLERTEYSEHPPRFEYRLTDKGRAFFDVILALMRWGDEWVAPEAGAPIEVVHRDDGHVVRPRVVDEVTGQPIDPRQVDVRPGPGFAGTALPGSRRR